MRFQPAHLFAALFAICAAGLLFQSPIAQNPAYHNFADARPMLGIPNFWNVASNIPFFFVGLAGLFDCFKNWNSRPPGAARLIPLVLPLGIFGVSFGSAYYHAWPSNATLIWDRLPMTLMFMALFSLVVYDFLGKRAGEWAFWLSVPFGVFSVAYWHFTEQAGHGDLRPYAFVQFFPMLAVAVLLVFFPKKVGYGRILWSVVGLYAVAKICEHFDREIFDVLGFWSGHTIKHLIGGISLWIALKILDGWPKTSDGQ